MIKVLMITHDTKIDRRIIQEANTLIRHGYDVKIIAMPYNGDEQYDVEIVRPNAVNIQRTARPKTFKLYSALKNAFPECILDKMRAIYDYATLDYEAHFEAFLLNTNTDYVADIYHVHDLPSLSAGAKLAGKYHGKLVYDSHELFVEQKMPRGNKKKWKKIESKYIHKSNAVITVNESIAKELAKLYNIEAPKVIMNKTDFVNQSYSIEDKTALRKSLGIPTHKKIILYQGGIVDHRNLDNLIYAMKSIQNAVLVLLGSGEYKSFLQGKVKEIGIEDKIFFLKEVAQEKLFEYTICLGDIGIIPYTANCKNNLYCTPNKLFEFISCGVPIITNDLPEIKRIVDTYDIGKVIDLSDMCKTADIINQLTNDKYSSKLEDYRKNIDRIKYTFSWEYEANVLLDIYNSLCK